MAISMAKAKGMCNASELALVTASSRQEIGRHTAARLKQKESRARKLRDKWRGLSNDQQRSSHAKGVVEGVNQRTAEKAALFDEVLGRYSAELAKREAAGETAGPMGRRRSTRSKKAQTSRADRAIVREALVDMKRELKAEAAAKSSAAPKAKTKSSAKGQAQGQVKSKSKAGVKSKAATKAKANAKSASKRAAARAAAAPLQPAGLPLSSGRGKSMTSGATGLQISAAKQRGAQAAAKQSRLRAGGMLNIQKHRSAANKRSQGRRDAR